MYAKKTSEKSVCGYNGAHMTDNKNGRETQENTEKKETVVQAESKKTNDKKGGADKQSPLGVSKDMVKKVPVGPGNFWNNVLSTVLVLIALTWLYSYVSESETEPEELSISEIAWEGSICIVRASC